MNHTTTDLIFVLPNVREGNRYFVAVTGATQTVNLEFEHVANSGVWFAHPDFVATPSAAGVVFSDVRCFSPRMRLRINAGQVTPWTLSCIKHVTDKL